MTKHVTSLKLSKKLKAAGVEQDSEFVYVDTRKSWKEYNRPIGSSKFVPFHDLRSANYECELVLNNPPFPNEGYNKAKPLSAFLASELLEMLKDLKIEISTVVGLDKIERWSLSVPTVESARHYGMPNKSLAEACGQMLIWTKENGYYE